MSDETNGFDASKLPGGNAMFPSTGDAGRDAEVAADIRRSQAYLAEGMCPNGCGPLVVDSPTKRHCERCPFVQERFVLGAGR